MLLKALGRSPGDRDRPALSGWEKDPPALLSNSASLSRFWYPAMASNPKRAVIEGFSRLIVLPLLRRQGRSPLLVQCLRSLGTIPPFAATLAITCLCSQMFMVAESPVSPV